MNEKCPQVRNKISGYFLMQPEENCKYQATYYFRHHLG